MIIHFFSIYDKKAEAFPQPPFPVEYKGHAVRAFTEMINDKSTDLGKHPEDYQLFYIGSFNKENGRLEQDNGATHILDGLSALNRALTLENTKPGPGSTDHFGGPQ